MGLNPHRGFESLPLRSRMGIAWRRPRSLACGARVAPCVLASRAPEAEREGFHPFFRDTSSSMSDYTHKSLPEVENMAPKFGMPDEMQARFAGQTLGLERTGITYFRLEPGFRIPFGHRHEDQEE